MKSTGALSQNTKKTKLKGTLWPADEIDICEQVIHQSPIICIALSIPKRQHHEAKWRRMELFDGHCLTFMLSINKTLMRIGMSHA